MLAAGTGEFLANPPVVIKNYQPAASAFRHRGWLLWVSGLGAESCPRIANNVGIATASCSVDTLKTLQIVRLRRRARTVRTEQLRLASSCRKKQ